MLQTPNKTTVNNVEPVLNRYSMGFAPELIEFLKTGQQTKTYRYGDKYNYLKPGDVITIVNTVTNKPEGKARIISKARTIFKKLPLNMSGHPTAKDKNQQRKTLKGYYAYLKRDIKDDDPFLIFMFQLIK